MTEPSLKEASPRKCPNGCGTMITIKKPSFVPPTDDAMDIIHSYWHSDDATIYTFIDAVCPECGYYECRYMSEQDFETWRKQLAVEEKP